MNEAAVRELEAKILLLLNSGRDLGDIMEELIRMDLSPYFGPPPPPSAEEARA
jgi:hypothetical protein